MSWEYSLSPSSVNTEAEVSQLMLAGRGRLMWFGGGSGIHRRESHL
jgi:hypothetical protein